MLRFRVPKTYETYFHDQHIKIFNLKKVVKLCYDIIKDGFFDKHASPAILSIKENAIVTDCVLLFKDQHTALSSGSKPINKRHYVKLSKRNVSFVTLVLTNEKCLKISCIQ